MCYPWHPVFCSGYLFGAKSSRVLSSSVMRSFHILSIGVSAECKAMNKSLTIDIQSLGTSQSVFTIEFNLPWNLLVSGPSAEVPGITLVL